MRVVVTGDRRWTDRLAVERVFDVFRPTTVIEGECCGLDVMARSVAESRHLEVVAVPAQWGVYGLGAGPIRNKWMLAMSPDIVLAFHNDIAASKGTRNCISQALKMGLEVWHTYQEGSLHIVRLDKTTWSY